MMRGGEVITVADIEGAAKQQGVIIQEGDVVLFHTGWMRLVGRDNEGYYNKQPGPGVAAAEYLAAKGVVAVGADTPRMDVIPHEDPRAFFPVHQTLLAKNGVYILENINTSVLVKDNVHEFLFVLGQPRFTGATQMIINPVAIR
jgi:kynurenine formamidase